MKYLLKVKDLSGRDFNALVKFETREHREEEFAEFVKADGADEEEIDEMTSSLDSKQSVVYEATEYEYLEEWT